MNPVDSKIEKKWDICIMIVRKKKEKTNIMLDILDVMKNR